MTSRALPNVLAQIVAARRQRLGLGPHSFGVPSTGALPPPATPESNPFLAALAARRGRAIIAEVKLASPRLGSLAGRFDPQAQAQIYAAGGAAALSVVVEPDFFGGSYELLAACKEASGLPAIAKDFVVDVRQLEAARQAGADAVLLVAALYPARLLAAFAAAARSLGLAPLVEIHDQTDVRKLKGERWELAGVNNRDLRTFAVDVGQSVIMLPSLPSGALRVSESGLESASDIGRLRDLGYDAFLIGESLLLAPDPAAKLAELLG